MPKDNERKLSTFNNQGASNRLVPPESRNEGQTVTEFSAEEDQQRQTTFDSTSQESSRAGAELDDSREKDEEEEEPREVVAPSFGAILLDLRKKKLEAERKGVPLVIKENYSVGESKSPVSMHRMSLEAPRLAPKLHISTSDVRHTRTETTGGGLLPPASPARRYLEELQSPSVISTGPMGKFGFKYTAKIDFASQDIDLEKKDARTAKKIGHKKIYLAGPAIVTNLGAEKAGENLMSRLMKGMQNKMSEEASNSIFKVAALQSKSKEKAAIIRPSHTIAFAKEKDPDQDYYDMILEQVV